MSEYVEVPFEGKAQDKSILLLAAAEDLGQEPGVVQTRTGGFYVPKEVADKAFGEQKDVSTRNSDDSDEKPPKKRAAKKSASKTTQE